mmetsp:Transcript_54096/g.65309  ORF Transcript_54096/g.65309 Transcript_54096/m.65309 type:complete len:263 (-) Transcript_54096:751-1539(-)
MSVSIGSTTAVATTETPGKDGILVVMRHSERLDDRAMNFTEISEEIWPDKMTRPYDPPISDDRRDPSYRGRELATEATAKLTAYDIARVVTSPFRRCIQTAAIVARGLGVSRVEVDPRLGEHVDAAMRCYDRWGLGAFKSPVRLLSVRAARTALEEAGGAQVQLVWDGDVGGYPVGVVESASALRERVRRAITGIAAGSNGVNTVIVTHGDLFNLYLPVMDWAEDIGQFAAEVAGFAVVKGPTHGPCVREEDILSLHRAYKI